MTYEGIYLVAVGAWAAFTVHTIWPWDLLGRPREEHEMKTKHKHGRAELGSGFEVGVETDHANDLARMAQAEREAFGKLYDPVAGSRQLPPSGDAVEEGS
ncbi:MAG TPA: hypothetical protein VG265_13465 [Gaiellaceae bacterium]|jgi:hypothetical protein|nr:hypothetical protein [Gaiellaceae bacterium]